MEAPQFKLEQFEGPLDLLLHLISKHKLNLQDIQIDLLLDQYLEWIDKATKMDLEVTSEFLEMAARLVYMKSAFLLPKYEEEGETLKSELTGQLIEYQALKEAAGILWNQFCADKVFFRSPQEIPPDYTYQIQHESTEILGAYLAVLGKIKRKMPPPKEAFSGIVKRRVVSVQSQIMRIFNLLYQNKSTTLDELFIQSEDRSEMVAAFLAVLELVRARRIKIGAKNQIEMQNAALWEQTSALDEEHLPGQEGTM